MPKLARHNRSGEKKVKPKPVPDPVLDVESATVLPVSPILYQPISSDHGGTEPTLRAASPEGLGEPRPAPGYVSILSQRLPEPTSYTGKNIIAFDFKDSLFRERPTAGI